MRIIVPPRSWIFARAVFLVMLAVAPVAVPHAICQDTDASQPDGSVKKSVAAVVDKVMDYLNMANQGKFQAFQPLSQQERNHMFTRSLINPIWYFKGAVSAGANQWSDKPQEWEQGASGYGKRFADIMGQYTITKTVTFGLESLLHEDNRYFHSSKNGFWPRMGYALSSGLLARRDNGKRYPSASLLLGFGSGAYLSRFWQPPSEHSIGDAAASFGISMGWNIGLGVVKEYLPDLLRPLMKGTGQDPSKKTKQPATDAGGR
jgi:hypothetical protein